MAVLNAEAATKAKMLCTLAPYLTDSLLQQALNLTFSLGLGVDQRSAELFEKLVPYLPDSLLEQALQKSLALKNDYARIKSLVLLIPRLALDQQQFALERGLEAASAITDSHEQAIALALLAPYVSKEQQQNVIERGLETARSVADHGQRALALSAFLSLQDTDPQLLSQVRYAFVQQLADMLHGERSELLNFILSREVLTAQILTAEVLDEIASDIINICEDWVWL